MKTTLIFLLSTLMLTSAQAQVLEMASGANHTCALIKGGLVKCWGFNSVGQLGLGDTINRGAGKNDMGTKLPAVDLGKAGPVVHVAAGGGVTCVIFESGNVKCWGENNQGNLGLGDTNRRGIASGQMGDQLPFVDLGANMKATQVTVDHTGYPCVLLANNGVKCWGVNTRGRLGAGNSNTGLTIGVSADQMGDNLKAIDFGTTEKIIQLSSGNVHHCALFESGRVKCWGGNDQAQLGYGDLIDTGTDSFQMNTLPFIDFGTSAKAIEVSAGNRRTCVAFDNGRVKCWGNNTNGSLGLGTNAASVGDLNRQAVKNLPFLDLGNTAPVNHIMSTLSHTCATFVDGKIKCWGSNAVGNLGLEQSTTQNVGASTTNMGDNLFFIQVGNGLKVKNISMGNIFTCALVTPYNELKCWGTNTVGQLGLGITTGIVGGTVGDMGEALPVVDIGD